MLPDLFGRFYLFAKLGNTFHMCIIFFDYLLIYFTLNIHGIIDINIFVGWKYSFVLITLHVAMVIVFFLFYYCYLKVASPAEEIRFSEKKKNSSRTATFISAFYNGI